MKYQEMKLYSEIKAELVNVIEAEDNAKAWKREAANRMKDVNALITAAEKVNKTKFDRKALLAEIRAELEADEQAETDVEESPED